MGDVAGSEQQFGVEVGGSVEVAMTGLGFGECGGLMHLRLLDGYCSVDVRLTGIVDS